MLTLEKLIENSTTIEDRLKHLFQNKSLLVLPFIHRSFYNEHRKEIKEHNERLEFLGDSILGLIISEYLYNHFPSETEGFLSQLRAHIVEATVCAQFVHKLNIESFLLLGKGEKMNEGRGRETILADLFEAVIGSIYLDGGLEAVKNFFWLHFEEEVQKLVKEPLHNWKAELQDYFQKKFQKTPAYKVVSEYGPDHNKQFEVIACIGDIELGRGSGSSKKEAEQAAAENALSRIQQDES